MKETNSVRMRVKIVRFVAVFCLVGMIAQFVLVDMEGQLPGLNKAVSLVLTLLITLGAIVSTGLLFVDPSWCWRGLGIALFLIYAGTGALAFLI